MDGEADSRKPLQTGALENGFEYLTDNPDNSNPVQGATESVNFIGFQFENQEIDAFLYIFIFVNSAFFKILLHWRSQQHTDPTHIL